MSQSSQSPITPKALIVGAGDAIGSAIMKRFAEAGYEVIGVRRNGEKMAPIVDELTAEGHKAHGWSCDARKEEDVTAVFEKIEQEIGELEIVVFNIGANVPMQLLDTPPKKFFKIWEMACYSGFLVGTAAARHLLKQGKGTIIFTGATASVRGAAGFGAFSSAKGALRNMVQSFARELMPQNIHVAHVVIDAAVDTPWIQENVLPLMKDRKEDDIVNPSSIAETYYQIHRQPRDAWTFETDLRPWCERW